jgi:hypothetical protein
LPEPAARRGSRLALSHGWGAWCAKASIAAACCLAQGDTVILIESNSNDSNIGV